MSQISVSHALSSLRVWIKLALVLWHVMYSAENRLADHSFDSLPVVSQHPAGLGLPVSQHPAGLGAL